MVVKGKMSKNNDLEKQRMMIIKRSAPVASSESEKTRVNFTLGISRDMLSEIEAALHHTAGLSKTGFILQAIHEKLNKK